jgi:hypothetical protein
MDNGLIFPYRLYTANAESSFAKDMKPATLRGSWWIVRPDWY